MHEYLFLLPILLFLLLGVISPGPSFVLVAQTAMAKSRKEAIATAFGMGIGACFFAIIASVGLFVLLKTVPWLYLTLKIIGATYLCVLAFKLWMSANNTAPAPCADNKNNSGIIKLFFIGLFTQLSNPKTALVFASAFAAFLPPQIPEYGHFLIASSAFIIDASWYVLVATLLSTTRAQKTYAKLKKYICRLASAFMGAVAIKLLFGTQPQ